MKNAPIVIIDIDGTIANIEHRLDWISGETKNWDAFHKACCDDLPINPMIELVNNLYENYHVALCTGRNMRNYEDTVNWLYEHDVCYDSLRMRKDKDFRPDTEIKPELFTTEELKQVAFAIDDRKRVVDMWRARGILALHCADGAF